MILLLKQPHLLKMYNNKHLALLCKKWFLSVSDTGKSFLFLPYSLAYSYYFFPTVVALKKF